MSSPGRVDRDFAATLSPRERRLASRLEGFGDIVFGFAVSQCALQLPTVGGHVDLGHPFNLLYYFGTFALLAVLWLTYHRLLSGPYKPDRPDLGVAFEYLALVSLMPYAMYSTAHAESLASARAGVAEYAILFASMMGLAAVLGFRNLRRGWWTLDDHERGLLWTGFLRQCVVCVMMALGAVVDLTLGPTSASLAFFGIFIVIKLVRMRFKEPPRSVLPPRESGVSTA
jgi:uncharacterized membrane protein